MDLRQLIQSLVEYAFGMWRFRWPALAAAWLVALAGWAWVLTLPDEYDANARVYVDTQTILRPLLGDMTVTTDTANQLRLVTQVLLSRPQLEAVAIQTGLDRRARNPQQLDELILDLQRQVQLAQARGTDLFTISYRDNDPAMARDVVQALLSGFMERSVRRDRADSAQAQRFLEQQIQLYEQRLVEAENRRAEFRKSNAGLMSASGGDYFARLQQAETSVREVQAQIDAVSEQRRELMRQIEGEAPVFGVVPSRGQGGPPTQFDADIARLEQQLSALQIQYTERHPEILRVRATLDALYQRQAEEREQTQATAFAGGASELDLNPVFQQLRVSLSNAEVELVALRSALRERQAGVDYLLRMVDTIPDIEAQLMRMDRDYDVVRRQYDALVQRLEAARLSEDVQVDTESLTFEVIDPPRLPLTPAGPNRPLLISGVLIAALGIATTLGFLFSQHGPVYFSGSRLSRKTGLPVFGMIATAPGYRSVYSVGLPFILAMGALIVLYLVLMGGLAGLLREFLPFL